MYVVPSIFFSLFGGCAWVRPAMETPLFNASQVGQISVDTTKSAPLGGADFQVHDRMSKASQTATGKVAP